MKFSLAKALLLITTIFPISSYANETAGYDKELNLIIPSEYLLCDQDSDCTSISTGVCGGDYRPVNSRYKSQLEHVVQAKRMTMNCSSFNNSATIPTAKCEMSKCQDS